jgi:hypothetical protein
MLCALPGIATNSPDPACEPRLNQKGKNAPPWEQQAIKHLGELEDVTGAALFL